MAYRSGFSRQRSRRRRQLLSRFALWLLGAGVFVGIGYSSYRSGVVLARMELQGLEDDIVRLTSQVEALRVENDRLRTDLSQARQTADGVKRRYETDVPSGGLASLVGLLRDRMGAGVKEERLSQILRDAENTRPCEGRFVRKRFAIYTGGPGAEESVGLLEGLVQVSASAPSSADDPAKAATVTIQRAWSAQPVKLTGLPVRHTIALNNAELKLVLEPSELRGYGNVTLSLCGRG
jgi:regulator of replication initiation timing